jgi:hypothetical protein
MTTRMFSTEARNPGLCPPCSGFMVQEWFWFYAFSDLPFQGVRCVMCGEILDPLILKHRDQRAARPLSPTL